VTLDASEQQCPYCGEPVELSIEPLGVAHEEYVEDCPVCCRPWNVHIERSEDALHVSLERSDG
jgi:hypothetical protein